MSPMRAHGQAIPWRGAADGRAVREMRMRRRTLKLARRESESPPPTAEDRHVFPLPRPSAPIAERSWWAGANCSPLPSYLAHYFWD